MQTELPLLAQWLKPCNCEASARIRFGKVTATPGGNVITITVGGSSTAITGVRYLASYTPAVNDIVAIVQLDGTLFVLGELA